MTTSDDQQLPHLEGHADSPSQYKHAVAKTVNLLLDSSHGESQQYLGGKFTIFIFISIKSHASIVGQTKSIWQEPAKPDTHSAR